MSSIEEIFTQKIPNKLKEKPDLVSINAVYGFDLGEDGGQWTLDLTKPGGEVRTGAGEDAQVTVTMKADDFVKVVDGSLNAQMAFMTGKLKIKGELPLALKLNDILA